MNYKEQLLEIKEAILTLQKEYTAELEIKQQCDYLREKERQQATIQEENQKKWFKRKKSKTWRTGESIFLFLLSLVFLIGAIAYASALSTSIATLIFVLSIINESAIVIFLEGYASIFDSNIARFWEWRSKKKRDKHVQRGKEFRHQLIKSDRHLCQIEKLLGEQKEKFDMLMRDAVAPITFQELLKSQEFLSYQSECGKLSSTQAQKAYQYCKIKETYHKQNIEIE